jgi:MoxR-like ATPase
VGTPDPAELRAVVEAGRAAVARVVVGQTAAIEGAWVALLTEGHALLEGPPGVAKTLLVRALAAVVEARFSRVQFTPDLLPADVTGSMVLRAGELAFRPGPIFTDLLLGDEINRAPAKVQSALLEAMQERAVTADGQRFSLGEVFTVFATQNPIEQEGTYPLPEAELDRFALHLSVGYPDEAAEREVLRSHHGRSGTAALAELSPVVDGPGLGRLRATVRAIAVDEAVLAYVVAVVRASRDHLAVQVGASPRAGLALLAAAKAQAAIEARGFVTPDDVKRWAPAVLRHRLVLAPGAELGGATGEEVVAQLLAAVPVPT